MDKNSICKINIDALLRFGREVGFDIYIRLSDDKTIKISHAEDYRQVLPKYKEKGIQYVYVVKEQYTQYLEGLKSSLTNKFYNPSTTPQNQIELLSESYKAVRQSLVQFGMNEVALSVAEELSRKSLDVISKSANIYQFFLDFKKNCDEQLMKKMMVSYTTTLMISNFDWQTAAIKEKAALSCILSDIILNAEELAELEAKKDTPDQLSEKVYNHPLTISKMLQEGGNIVSKETAIMVEQHHEKPDGIGFPRKLRHTTITLLSAIQIVAEDFIENLMATNFDHRLHDEILRKFLTRYYQANFRKAAMSLCKMFGMDVPGF